MTKRYMLALSQTREEASIALIDANSEEEAIALHKKWTKEGKGDYVDFPPFQTSKLVTRIDTVVDVTPQE